MIKGTISISPSSSQLIRYARACSAYDQFLVRGNLLTNKLMSQGFQMSRLQAAFCKFYGRYNDLIHPYNLSLGHMLSDIFQNNLNLEKGFTAGVGCLLLHGT
jgi:hypothetical protein